MGRLTWIPLAHRQGLNAVMLYSKHAPKRADLKPAAFIRALRAVLGMTQAELARRSDMTQAQVARIESGSDAKMETLRKIFDAMFCDLLIIPKPRKRPSEALADRRLEKPYGNPWAELDPRRHGL